ncbi:hypothetical protein HDU92_004594 [Lobulomyces angularis]|nr:hypothetical protein HDU92_004594 [Lobulomyces angularis]
MNLPHWQAFPVNSIITGVPSIHSPSQSHLNTAARSVAFTEVTILNTTKRFNMPTEQLEEISAVGDAFGMITDFISELLVTKKTIFYGRGFTEKLKYS